MYEVFIVIRNIRREVYLLSMILKVHYGSACHLHNAIHHIIRVDLLYITETHYTLFNNCLFSFIPPLETLILCFAVVSLIS